MQNDRQNKVKAGAAASSATDVTHEEWACFDE